MVPKKRLVPQIRDFKGVEVQKLDPPFPQRRTFITSDTHKHKNFTSLSDHVL